MNHFSSAGSNSERPPQAKVQRASVLLKLGQLEEAAKDFSELVIPSLPLSLSPSLPLSLSPSLSLIPLPSSFPPSLPPSLINCQLLSYLCRHLYKAHPLLKRLRLR